jgi:two-component system phosphate regulon sensor histidine kinase PhoR
MIVVICGMGILWMGALFYLWSLRKGYKEMAGRATGFAKGVDVLRVEKRVLLENLDEGALITNSSGKVTYINLKAESLLRINEENFLGRRLFEVPVTSDLWKNCIALVAQSLKCEERVHTFLTLSEKEKIYLQLIAIPTGDGEGAVLLIQDRSNQQKILEMGKDFIANASHELKTPVTIIRGFAETLKDLPEVSEVMYESILEKIIRNCERMEGLVKNLLTISDLENGSKENMQECDLIQVVEESCNQCITAFPECKIEQFFNEEAVYVWGDPYLLELALFNILKNAVRYSPKPADIKVTINAKETEVDIHIEDKGIGIPSQDIDRIFDRFFTVDKTHSRRLGGAGLGLSIVKVITQRHEGKISVTSKEQEGTTFHISLQRL